MKIFINGIGNISPQKTWDDTGLLSPLNEVHDNKLLCIEPDYTKYIDVKQLRRMSRIIRMGIASSSMALKQANITIPDGIITGTGYGCLEDTGSFLTKITTNREEALNPTPFIQSTHNTIGSQIALLLQCQAYNQTYAHGAFSFESALLDASLQLSDDDAKNILVGGVDEITPTSHQIQSRFDIFRPEGESNLQYSGKSGTINGEGAAYFVLSGKAAPQAAACCVGVATCYKPDTEGLQRDVESFLNKLSIKPNEIDLLLLGSSGLHAADAVIETIAKNVFESCSTGRFKHLCGEYPVASAFAFWLSARILKEAVVPEIVLVRDCKRPVKRVLVFNQYFGTHYSLMLFTTC